MGLGVTVTAAPGTGEAIPKGPANQGSVLDQTSEAAPSVKTTEHTGLAIVGPGGLPSSPASSEWFPGPSQIPTNQAALSLPGIQGGNALPEEDSLRFSPLANARFGEGDNTPSDPAPPTIEDPGDPDGDSAGSKPMGDSGLSPTSLTDVFFSLPQEGITPGPQILFEIGGQDIDSIVGTPEVLPPQSL